MFSFLSYSRIGIVWRHGCLQVWHQACRNLVNSLMRVYRDEKIHLLPIPPSTLVDVVQPEVVLQVEVLLLHLVLFLPHLPLLRRGNFLLTFYKLSTSCLVFTHRQFRCFVSLPGILVPQTPSLLCRVRCSFPLHLLENLSSQVKQELKTFCSGLRCFILSSNLYLASSRDLKKVKRRIKSSSPFKVSHSLFSVIAQLMDVHYASVPHHVGRVDEIAWVGNYILGVHWLPLTGQKRNVIVIVVFWEHAVCDHLPYFPDLRLEWRLFVKCKRTFSFLYCWNSSSVNSVSSCSL